MAKPTNSERIYSDKLPIVLKPVGCSYTDAEWKRYIRLFPANGWGIADEKDTRDNGKISDVVKQIAEKHPKQIKEKKCLLCGCIDNDTYNAAWGMCKSCNHTVWRKGRSKRNAKVIDPLTGKETKEWNRDKEQATCVECGAKGITYVSFCMCLHCGRNQSARILRISGRKRRPATVSQVEVYENKLNMIFPNGPDELRGVKLIRCKRP